jgi:hypothetical protein
VFSILRRLWDGPIVFTLVMQMFGPGNDGIGVTLLRAVCSVWKASPTDPHLISLTSTKTQYTRSRGIRYRCGGLRCHFYHRRQPWTPGSVRV